MQISEAADHFALIIFCFVYHGQEMVFTEEEKKLRTVIGKLKNTINIVDFL